MVTPCAISGGESLRAYSIHFVQLMLTCTAHPHPKVATEALHFWDMFADLRTSGEASPWAPEDFMQWLARENVIMKVLTALIKGCTLPPSSETWARDELSEEREVYEEYRLHALDSLHTVASSWPVSVEANVLVSMVCDAHISGTSDIQKIEAVLWIVSGIIDATDVMEDYEYDSDECLDTRGLGSIHPTVINPFSSAVGLGAETNPGIPAGPWFDL